MTRDLSRRTVMAGMTAAISSTAVMSHAMAQPVAITGQGGQRPAEAPARPRGQNPAEVINDPRAVTFDIMAKPVDGQEAEQPWRILVGLPGVPPPAEGYSLLVALDGNATFPMFWHHRQNLAPNAPVLLVGIGYPVTTEFDISRRWFDLTSPAMLPKVPQPGLRDSGDNRTGGRDRFLAMIADQLLPELGQRWPVNMADSTLYGHSLGGLFVLHVLLTRPNLFARLAPADPSLWWNNGETLLELAAFLGGVEAAGGKLSPPLRLHLATSGPDHSNSARQLNSRLPTLIERLSSLQGMEFTYRAHPNETHPTLIRPSAADALKLHLGIAL